MMRTITIVTFAILGGCLAAAGSQLVHMYYEPLKDIDKQIEEEFARRKKELGLDRRITNK